MSNKNFSRYKELLAHNQSFRRLWIGQTLSFTGNAVYDITLMWLVYEKTGSAIQVSMILVASFLPELIFGMLLGALTDRSNQKRLMQISDLLCGLVLLMLSLSFYYGAFHLWQIYVVTVLLSVLGLLFSIAQGAWLPEIVDRDHLMTANALMSTSRQITRLVGSAVGGSMVALIGSTSAIAYDAFTFLASLAFIQLIPYGISAFVKSSQTKKASIFSDILEGIRWLIGQRALLLMVIIGTLSNMALGPTNVLPAVYIKMELHADASALGIFDAAIGLGIVIGSLLIGYMSPQKIGLWFTAGLGFQGLSMLIVSQSQNLVVACIGNFILGFAVIMAALPMSTMFQLLTPKDKRGRVNSIISMGLNLSVPITYGGIGILATIIGTRTSYILGALLLLICALSCLISVPLRQSTLKQTVTNQHSAI